MSDQVLDAFTFVIGLLGRVDPFERVDDDVLDVWADLVDEAEDVALAMPEGAIDEATAAHLRSIAETSGLTDSQACEALAWGIDRALWPRFTEQWISRRGAGPLQPGEWFPVTDIDRGILPDHPTSLPSSLAVRAGELPHVRAFDQPGGVKVNLEVAFAETIDAALDCITTAATIHPNVDPADFEPAGHAGRLFPTRPTNAEQTERLTELTAIALEHAPIVVGPELCCPPDDELDRVRAAFPGLEPRLLVVGSRHEIAADQRVNRAVLLVGPDVALHHDKFAPYLASGTPEGLSARTPEMTLLVSREWRVALLVCKDLLSPDVVSTLCRVGANVVLVPAWSPKVDGFRAAAEMLTSHCQAIVVIANGPRQSVDDDKVASVLARPVRADTLATRPFPAAPTSERWDLWERSESR